MTALLEPRTVAEAAEMIRATPRLIPVGSATKPRLSDVDAVRMRMTGLSGVVEYEPSEFTFTALAGTPVKTIVTILAERGQYLPFDPMLVEAGATLGGTIASGLSGPGRHRYGGVRDFILGVRLLDGAGRLLRLGGKVVKNAAGFDVPKFLVGSAGRFGVIADVSFKVFPRAVATSTIRIPVADLGGAAAVMTAAANSRWDLDALDLPPDDMAVWLRLAGPPEVLPQLAAEVLGRWRGEMVTDDPASRGWSSLREIDWAHAGGALAKVVLEPTQLAAFEESVRRLGDLRLHVSGGGSVAYVSLPPATPMVRLHEGLRELGLRGMSLRGDGPLWLGAHTRYAIDGAVKRALDGEGRFPGLEE